MLTSYDAIAVLCGGLRRDPGGYRPASFTDSDEHGMLGSHIRVLAAADLYRSGCAELFVFCTGISQKSRARFGAGVPPEAVVYAEHFRAEAGDGPVVILEQESVNTAANLAAIAALAQRRQWARMAIVTSEYHLARARELFRRTGSALAAEFLSAEAIVMAARPGVHDSEIAAGYASPAGLRRTARERRGLADLYAGRYDVAEQLGPAGAGPGPPVPAPDPPARPEFTAPSRPPSR